MNMPERPLTPPEPKEPDYTDIECSVCGEYIKESYEYYPFTDRFSDRVFVICEDCYNYKKSVTAWNPQFEEGED